MSEPKNPHEIPIKVFASSKTQKMYDSQDEGQIADVIREKVLPAAKVAYHSVSVKVERTRDGSPKALIAYLLREDTYTADVTRVDIDQNYKVVEIQENGDFTDIPVLELPLEVSLGQVLTDGLKPLE